VTSRLRSLGRQGCCRPGGPRLAVLDRSEDLDGSETLEAKTRISGLTAGTLYYFRVQALITTGEQNWSQVVSLLVS
jgi:hypothetical protein